jgi:hypothetical protein
MQKTVPTRALDFLGSPHPFMLVSMALGILVNDSQFPVSYRHWVMDAMAILSGVALMLIQWKKDPAVPVVVAGNSLGGAAAPADPVVVALPNAGPVTTWPLHVTTTSSEGTPAHA